MQLFDTHCHLGWKTLAADLPVVLERARQHGLRDIVDVGIDVKSSEAARTRRGQGAAHGLRLHPTAGLHPCDCAGHDEDFARIEELARDPHCVAIGETGLDLYWDSVPLEVQRRSLDRHLALGRELGKPVVLHCRDAFDELFEQLGAQAPVHGVLHCFTGSPEQAARCVELGLMVSFGGPLTYKSKKNEPIRAAARLLPTDRLLIETDAPFLPPQPWRGKTNEPSYVRATFDRLAQERGAETAQERSSLAEHLLQNSRNFFGLRGED
jgi:TatD DNase family protein